jgi:hypothetical protein
MEPLERSLRALPDFAPNPVLRARILAAVASLSERAIRIRRRVFGTAATLSALSAVPAAWYAYREISQSAFMSYLSLLFTDTGAAFSHWRELALSLLESAPIVGLTLFFAALFVFLASLKALAPYMQGKRLSYRVS